MPQEPVTGNKTIAKNATMLYIRMFFTMAISFYTSRIVLEALGVSDYGIYNVVGGITVLINVFIGALGSSTSRFLTFALGKNDIDNLKLTFSTAAWIHIGLALFFVVAAETIGLWFVNTQLVIPEGRMIAANWVYQASIITVAMGITQTPYNASITSHEHMSAFAYISVVDALVKLGIAAVVLVYSGDHLILYSILLVLSSISFQLYYRYYCVRHFEECHITSHFERILFKEMLAFSGWSMFRNTAFTVASQGVNILINRFFGTVLNAAAGVALQVQGLLYAFTGNISTAFKPQITKSYAAADYHRTNDLINMSAKFTAIVTTLTTVPFIFNLDFLMSLWLKDVPPGAVVICQICLFSNFFNSFNWFFSTAIEASGKIKSFSFSMSIIHVTSLAGTYLILKLTHNYVYSYIWGVASCPMSTMFAMILLRKVLPFFSIRSFVGKIYIPLLFVFCMSLAIAALISHMITSPSFAFPIITIVCTTFVIFVGYKYVLDESAKILVKDYVKSMRQRIRIFE